MPAPVKITQAVAAAAVPCFYLNVSLRRVARACGVTPMALKHAIDRGRQPGAPEHLARLSAAYDAIEQGEEYWEHRQSVALTALTAVAGREDAE